MVFILSAVLVAQIYLLVKSIIKQKIDNKLLLFDIASFIAAIIAFVLYRDRMDIYAFYYEIGMTRINFIALLVAIAAYFIMGFITLMSRFIYSKNNSVSSICMMFGVPLLLLGIYMLYLEINNNLQYVPTPATVISIEEKQLFSERTVDNPNGIVYRLIVEFERNGIKEVRAVNYDFFDGQEIRLSHKVSIYIVETEDGFVIIKPNLVYFEMLYVPCFVMGVLLVFIALNTKSKDKQKNAPAAVVPYGAEYVPGQGEYAEYAENGDAQEYSGNTAEPVYDDAMYYDDAQNYTQSQDDWGQYM